MNSNASDAKSLEGESEELWLGHPWAEAAGIRRLERVLFRGDPLPIPRRPEALWRHARILRRRAWDFGIVLHASCT